MKKHEIFETNPSLKEVHMTSDGQAFYNENDAKMHAKTLEDKQVELVLNPSHISDIQVVGDEDVIGSVDVKLEDLTKAELVVFAKENLELELSIDSKKQELLDAIEAEFAKRQEVSIPVEDNNTQE